MDAQPNTDTSAFETPVAGHESSTGLDENVAGALSYLFGFLTGLVFFLVEKENQFVRFHAAQSMVLFGGIAVLAVVTGIVSSILTTVLFSGSSFFLWGLISLLFGLFWLVIGVAALGLWAYLMYSAYSGKLTRIPVAAGIADSLV